MWMHPLGLEMLALILVEGLIYAIFEFPREFFLRLRCKRVFRRWLKQNDSELVSSEVRTFWQGPFPSEPEANYTVTRLEVRDRTGATRKAFVRCGNHSKGFFGTHDLEVRWDEASASGASAVSRLFALLLAPALTLVCAIGAFAWWLSQPGSGLLRSNPHLGSVVVGAVMMGFLIALATERRRGYPRLKKVIAMDRAQFCRFLVLIWAPCLLLIAVTAPIFLRMLRFP
jgi:hypothetical protein